MVEIFLIETSKKFLIETSKKTKTHWCEYSANFLERIGDRFSRAETSRRYDHVYTASGYSFQRASIGNDESFENNVLELPGSVAVDQVIAQFSIAIDTDEVRALRIVLYIVTWKTKKKTDRFINYN